LGIFGWSGLNEPVVFSAVDRITASLSPGGRHKLFRLASHLHGSPVDFAQQAGHVVRDHIDDVQPERIRGGKTPAGLNRCSRMAVLSWSSGAVTVTECVWAGNNPRFKQADRERFYLALDRVAREAAFDPEEMGDYLRAKLGFPSGDDHDDNALARRVTDAWAVRDFLVITGAATGDAHSPGK
jgi:hypothetical protein